MVAPLQWEYGQFHSQNWTKVMIFQVCLRFLPPHWSYAEWPFCKAPQFLRVVQNILARYPNLNQNVVPQTLNPPGAHSSQGIRYVICVNLLMTCPPKLPLLLCRVCSTFKEQTNVKELFHRSANHRDDQKTGSWDAEWKPTWPLWNKWKYMTRSPVVHCLLAFSTLA